MTDTQPPEPMDPDEAQERLDELGEHIDETKRELSDVLDPTPQETFVSADPTDDNEEAGPMGTPPA